MLHAGKRHLHYETEAGAAPTLLLLHPLGGDLRFWDPCRRLWAGRHGLVAYDRPGAGASPAPDAPQDLDANVEDIEALRAELGLAAIVPIGVAIGAMIAAAYAAAHPRHTAAVVLCNPALRMQEAGRAMTLARVERVRAGGIAALMPDIVDRAFNDLPRDDRYHAYVAAFQRNDAIGYERSALGALDMDIAPALPRIECPALVAVGQHDVLFPVSEARQVASLLKHPTFEELPNAAHFPPFQDPEAFTAAVDQFLTP